ncbi:tRNA pseudouridine(38-40) synthase TruA [Candidatus Kapaibacterium sp.]
MRTLKLIIQYDGTNYSGWQIQKNSCTIQEVLEIAIFATTGSYYNTIAAGRTDAGVHAFGQVVSVAIDDNFKIPEKRILYSFNSKLPKDIRIIECDVLDHPFHARFDAKNREYVYFLSNKYDIFSRNYTTFIKFPFDKQALIESAKVFMRKDDFTSFSKYNPDNVNPVCDITLSQWEHLDDNKMIYKVRANHFLYGMVRSLVGVMLDVAKGKRSIENVMESLAQKDRNLNSPLVKPNGLFLNKVIY